MWKGHWWPSDPPHPPLSESWRSALLSPAAPTSLLCPGGRVEDPPRPAFVPAMIFIPPGFSVAKSVTCLLSLTCQSVPQVSGNFSITWKQPKEVGGGFWGPLLPGIWQVGRLVGWQRVAELWSGLFPMLRSPHVVGLLHGTHLVLCPSPAGDLHDILSTSRKRSLWIFF